jgi:hypothetical protein
MSLDSIYVYFSSQKRRGLFRTASQSLLQLRRWRESTRGCAGFTSLWRILSFFFYDHVGNTYHLSELTELSVGRIPYPDQFTDKLNYEQKSLLQDLRMKDVLTWLLRTNWIKQGEEFMQQIVSIFREESLPQTVSGIYEQLRSSKICLNKIFT